MWEAIYWLVLLLFVVSMVAELRNLKERLKDLVRGIKGVLFVPVTMSIVFAYAAFLVCIAPQAVVGGHVLTYFGRRFGVPMIVFAAIVCLLLNYYEEKYFRDSVLDVAVWAALHLLALVPPTLIPAIFFMGLVFKKIKETYGLETAYAAHFFHNVCILGLLTYLTYFCPLGVMR